MRRLEEMAAASLDLSTLTVVTQHASDACGDACGDAFEERTLLKIWWQRDLAVCLWRTRKTVG